MLSATPFCSLFFIDRIVDSISHVRLAGALARPESLGPRDLPRCNFQSRPEKAGFIPAETTNF
jgi:hypothetical protein